MTRVLLAAALLAALWTSSFATPSARAVPASEAIDRDALAARVRSEFLHAWRGYQRHALGHDELKPRSGTAKDWYGSSLLMTPVDALDTMLLMGLTDEAEKTKTLILNGLSFDRDISVQNFEMTIRLLGGLLSAYEMTSDRRFLALAEDLGNRLLPVFDSPTGMPYTHVNLRTGKASGSTSNPAEIGTLILEFGTLSRHTKREVFLEKPRRALAELYRRRDPHTGLVGEEIDVETGQWKSATSHVGGGIDSYYEYLVKCERLFGDHGCGAMYRESIAAANRWLADDRKTGLWYGEADMRTGRRTATTYGALHAFLPAVLLLGGDLSRARRLQDSGLRMWRLHSIEPEEIDYGVGALRVKAPGYALRPEIVESAWYLSRATKDPKYLEMGKEFFEDLIRYCRTDDGYTVLTDVRTKEKGDLMPSYFLAETLKYLYLLFAPPETLDLNAVVLNTEAHPFKRAANR
jgi:mannosidase alpha-like ER degradation enhancer 2